MVETSICVKGYAKINLHLDVVGKMENGYHQVETVMQTVSLHDDVALSVTEKNAFSLRCNIQEIPTDGRNLAIRAAQLFCEATGISKGLHIEIKKRIPMAAGLAGGSADAAAVLIGMNRLYGDLFSVDALCELGGRLGADVPFCIVGGTAYADGKGDVLHPFPAMPDCALIIACAGEGVSTPWAYGMLDEQYHDFSNSSAHGMLNELEESMRMGNLPRVAQSMYNIFEAPVLAQRVVATEIRKLLLNNGALGAMMSGSGPSVFGVFENENYTQEAMRALTEHGYKPYLCRPIEKRI